MARGIEGKEPSSTQGPSQSSKKNQKTLLGFFQKTPVSAANPAPKASLARTTQGCAQNSIGNLTPAPSSDAAEMSSPVRIENKPIAVRGKSKENGLPSPVSPGDDFNKTDPVQDSTKGSQYSSPVRKAKKRVNYAESADDDDEEQDVIKPLSGNASKGRAVKRRKVRLEDSEDEFGDDAVAAVAAQEEDNVEDFIVPDESEEELPASKKRRKSAGRKSREEQIAATPPPSFEKVPTEDMEIPTESTAQQWKFDPEDPEASYRTRKARPAQKPSSDPPKKQKAHTREPEQRYPWLAQIQDADRHRPGHPDYDPRTVYIPPLAWTNFSPFEKQYWEIKQKFWDTIVFFKKGKFYELYENDATIGHQLFDLKLTDRVNMRMVGVPEATLDHWACQFVAKGFKIARVDQMESALAKEMRERGTTTSAKMQKEEKVIRRELAGVLTGGTLVDAGMLQGDMSTYCVAIKEIDQGNLPAFGIAFVDTATAQFQLTGFVDDAEMTKFETFVAQIRPGELLLEKSCISARAVRMLKNNTGPTTIWNYLKPTKEFWPSDITTREVDASGYFVKQGDDADDAWPRALEEAKEKELVMSSFGALLQYLRTLKIDHELVSLGNFTWYDPIRRGSTLVLDGQSLINLEIFANSYDGGSEGTLFSMLNHCVTPFGKRMLRSWVCHPLQDSNRINQRLDAVEALNADSAIMERFMASLTRLPDLERLISRVHAKRCKAQDFVRVLEGFEQIEYTMSLLGGSEGEGLIGQLITSMPDLGNRLDSWKSAFDRKTAKEAGILVPEPGIEEDFDISSKAIEDCESALNKLLQKARKDLGSSAICFRDNGKEIYQLEVPAKIKSIPKSWDQMSSTAKVKRYYSPELRKLVRDLQEARETHAQIVKEVAGRFYARFDIDYSTWLSAVHIIAQLDCLISLARASASLGTPSCRPAFMNDDSDSARGLLDFRDLRHPTMLTTVTDFIPNDVTLGGPHTPNLHLLTGANAAGKSTILRMTCVAVILAQLGCYVPASSAQLTPRDRIMSRLGANDNILQQQSTFFVELAETKKILAEATPRSLVILDELGRGTSSVDGLAVAEAVLHHIAGSVGCLGFFATHYHSLAASFVRHPEVAPKRMKIAVDDEARRVTFLYRLEDGVAEGSFGMHCASMCGIPRAVVERAEEAAGMWEHSGRVREKVERETGSGRVGLGWLSDVSWMLREDESGDTEGEGMCKRAIDVLAKAVEAL